MEELLVAAAEAVTIISIGSALDRRVAEAGVALDAGWATVGYVIASCFEAVVDTLLVDLNARRRRAVIGLRMRAASHEGGSREQSYCEDLFHGHSLGAPLLPPMLA
jgi:hypothetical protein